MSSRRQVLAERALALRFLNESDPSSPGDVPVRFSGYRACGACDGCAAESELGVEVTKLDERLRHEADALMSEVLRDAGVTSLDAFDDLDYDATEHVLERLDVDRRLHAVRDAHEGRVSRLVPRFINRLGCHRPTIVVARIP